MSSLKVLFGLFNGALVINTRANYDIFGLENVGQRTWHKRAVITLIHTLVLGVTMQLSISFKFFFYLNAGDVKIKKVNKSINEDHNL